MQLITGLCTLLFALGLSLLTAAVASAQPTTFYVAAGGTDAGNGCTSSANPCATVSHAVTYATANGDTVQVSGTIDDNPTVPYGVTITGAEAAATSPAVISGDIALEYAAALADLTVDGSVRAMGYNTVSQISVIGGGISAYQASLTMTDSTISGGGGIDAEQSEVTVSDSTISANGQGIGLGASTLSVSDSIISGNRLDGIYGGLTSLGLETATVTNSVISDNGGVGIDVIGETSVSDSTISDNGGGGDTGVYGPLTVTNSTVSDNGGAGIAWGDCYNIYPSVSPMPFLSCPVTVTGSRITGNKGDGIDAEMGDPSSNATVFGSTISANSGVGVKAEQGAVVSASTIEGNQGGGLYVNAGGAGFLQGGNINISGNTISGNTAPAGAGMYICECDGLPASGIVISGNTITGNKATEGGGIYMAAPLVFEIPVPGGAVARFVPTISDNTVVANTATDGGGVYNLGLVTVTRSTFSGNVASQGNVVDNAAAPAGASPSSIWAAADIFDGGCQNLGAWNDGGYNVGSDATCLNGGTGDVSYGSGLSQAGLLGPLAQNGGPTETMPPLTRNPAFGLVPSGTLVVLDGDAVSLCPVTDQRGVPSSPGSPATQGRCRCCRPRFSCTFPPPTKTTG